MRILFIYLVFYSSVSAKTANEFYVTFEMMKGSSEYLEIMQKKAHEYSQKGLKCYIAKGGSTLHLRCNDTKTVDDYKESISKLDDLNVNYKVVSIKKPTVVEEPKSLSNDVENVVAKVQQPVKKTIVNRKTLKDGYEKYNNSEYSEAKQIFQSLYSVNHNLENSYAMGLIALHEKDYPRVREYLEPYLNSKKADKLYYDSIIGEYYSYIKYGNNARAIALKNRYKKQYPALAKLTDKKPELNLGDGYEAFNAKEYNKAKKIFQKIYNKKADLESSYAMALISLKEKDFNLVRRYLKPYNKSSKKASKLYYDSIVSQYYNYINTKQNKKAIALKRRYSDAYPKLRSLAEPKVGLNLGDGYKAYNDKDYQKAETIFRDVYNKKRDVESAYAMSLIALHKKDYSSVRGYLSNYTNSSDKASKLYYDSIVSEYYSDIQNKRNKDALRLVAKYKSKYPKLNSLPKPKADINLGTGYKAYNNKEFTKAKKIFTQLYNKDHNLENSYAMGLVYLREKNFTKMRAVLEPFYKVSAKASKLYYDSILNEYYMYRSRGDNKRALALLNRYKTQYPQLRKINDALLEDANKYIANGDFYKAEELLINNGYEDTQKYIFEKKYEKALQLKSTGNDLEAIELITPYLATHTKAAKLYSDISVSMAGLYLANKNYKRAKNLLKPIAASSVEAEELYHKIAYTENLDYGWTSYNNRLRGKSLKYFEEACSISEQDSCLEGIMNASYKLKDYKRSLPSAEKIYDKTGSQDAAFIAYNSALKLNDKEKEKEWYNLLAPKNKKLALYRLVSTDKDRDELNTLFVEALKNNPYDFDLLTNYLYFLKGAKMNTEFERVMQEAQANITATTDVHILERIKREYQNARLYEMYRDGKNQECFEYGNKVLREKDDVSYKRMHGWCAFKSKNYHSAERIFASINAKYDENHEDIYGQFISAFNDKNYKKAKKLLAYLNENSENDQDRSKITDYYLQMNELDDAQKVIAGISDKKIRESLQVKLNNRYKYSRNEIYALAGGIHYKKRSIEDGLHTFTQVLVPIDLDYYTKEYWHLYLDADIMSLNDRFEGSDQANDTNNDLGWVYEENKSLNETVFMPKIGAEFKYFNIELGVTPLGASLSPDLTGKVQLHTLNEEWNFSASLIKTEIDDSMISLVGVNYVDDYNDVEWGRVVKSGLELGITRNGDVTYSLDLGYYPSFSGVNVVDNEEVKVVGSVTYHMPTVEYAYLDYGFIAVYDSYEVNSDLYTYGNGGYFSPQEFYLGSFVVDIANTTYDDFYWRARLSLGYEQFEVLDQYKYPLLDDNTQNLSSEQRNEIKYGYDESGLTYKVTLGAGYKLTDKLDIVGATSIEEIKQFNVFKAGVSLVYSFERKRKVDLYNFHNPHRIDSTLR
jgi:hypothetical protein